MEKVLKINVPEGYEVDKEKSTFESIVFRVLPEKRLPESWDELNFTGRAYFVHSGLGRVDEIDINNAKNLNILWPTREEAEASIALAQLLQLRDRYNEGWKPDWTKGSDKYVIYFREGEIHPEELARSPMPLSFKSPELRDKFLSCPEIRKLIEIAKPLL